MKMIAVFTLGADEMRIRQMIDIAESWGFGGKYSDSKILLNDANKKKFDSVLVVDIEAIDEDIRRKLKEMGIEIINFRDRKRLEKKVL